MSEYIEFAVRVPKDEADSFIARFGKSNVKILGFLLGEEIVRCRDCEFFDAPGNMGQWCTLLEFGMKNIANGFCAWGERREDA